MKADHKAAMVYAETLSENGSDSPRRYNLAAAYLELRELAKASLDARGIEAKAVMSYDVAKDNFDNPQPEGDAMEESIIKASLADAALRKAIGE